MSLKSIGELNGFAELLRGFSSFKDVAGYSKDVDFAFEQIRDSLKDLSVDEAIKKLQGLKLNPSLSKEILEAANKSKLLTGSADEVADAIKKVGESSSFVDDLGLAFKGLGTEVLSVLKMLATNPLTWAIAGGLVLAGIITVAFNHVSKAGERAREATEEAINNYEVISSEVDNRVGGR